MIYMYIYIIDIRKITATRIYFYKFTTTETYSLVVNFSSCYFPYINYIRALFLILSTLVKIHGYLYIISRSMDLIDLI